MSNPHLWPNQTTPIPVRDLYHAPQTPQNRSGGTMVHTMSCQTYTMTNDGTGDAAKIIIIQEFEPLGARVEAWSAKLDRDQAERYGCLASATLTMQEGDSIHSYTQRVHEQAAILGMDTLRELARPILRDVPTDGEA